MRISDWSSDVCSSDLRQQREPRRGDPRPDRDRPALPGDLAGHLQQVRPPAHGDRTGLLMATFPVLSTMANGISVFRTWMDAIGDNLATLNTVRRTAAAAFQARYVGAEAVHYGSPGVSGGGTGSRVAAIEYGSAEGRLVQDR